MSKIDALTKTLYGRDTEKVAVIHAAYETPPVTVAMVEVKRSLPLRDKLEKAFVLTNSIKDAWYRNEEVKYIGPENTCRSTSAGDMVLVGNTKYLCDHVGWKTLEGEVIT